MKISTQGMAQADAAFIVEEFAGVTGRLDTIFKNR